MDKIKQMTDEIEEMEKCLGDLERIHTMISEKAQGGRLLLEGAADALKGAMDFLDDYFTEIIEDFLDEKDKHGLEEKK